MSGRELAEWHAFYTVESQIAEAIRVHHTDPQYAHEMAWKLRPGDED